MNENLASVDPEIARLVALETAYQRDQIRLIASENYASAAVIEATATVLMNKYSEGYPGKRYYEGQVYIDQVEQLALDRATSLFGAEHANVQPHGGSPANLAVYTALMNPGDTLLGMSLPAGGHLTHGWKVSVTGKFWKPVQYGVHPETHLIDMNEVRRLAHEHKPKVIVCGASAYPRVIDFAAFRAVADEVGAYLFADMAHISGLVAGGAHPSPVPYADAVTTTTHKTLRGPRGGFILSKTEAHAKAVNSAIFPGVQGGPLMHVIAAKAVAFKEAMEPSFKVYQTQVIDNARAMASALQARGLRIVSGRTDCHLFLVDLRQKKVTGKDAEALLGEVNMTVNKNAIPNDPEKPFVTSGIRLGSPAMTTRGFGVAEVTRVGELLADVLDAPGDPKVQELVRAEVKALCARFPVYR